MKKIILIIAIALCIFQMVVLATAIDIGSPAINRGSSTGTVTSVNKNTPANDSGTITSVEIWSVSALDNCEIATFFVVSGNNLSTRDTHSIGAVTGGSKQTFSGLSLAVQAGDYIGLYYTSGWLEVDGTGGDGRWYLTGDQIPCTNATFTLLSTQIISLCGTGTTEEGEEVNVIFFGMNF